MPRHRETKHLPYTPEQMFDLVADVGRYAEFLPWVVAVRVRSSTARPRWSPTSSSASRPSRSASPPRVESTGRIGSTSIISKGRSNICTTNGASSRAEGGGPSSSFRVDFAFKKRLFETLAGQMFDRALRRMIGAFETARRSSSTATASAVRARRAPPEGGRPPRSISPKNRRSAMDLVGIGAALGAGEDDGADRLLAVPPPGPAMPVIATATSASECGERALRHRPGGGDRHRAERVEHVA